MSASVWNPSSSGTTVNADNTLKYQSFTALEGQTDFVLDNFTIVPGSGSSLLVYNGAVRRLGIDYVEISANQIKLLFPCNAGDEVIVFGFVGISVVSSTRNQVKNFVTATAGQVNISTGVVYDSGAGATLVFKNGLVLNPTEYTEVAGSSYITLVTPAVAGDKFVTVTGQVVGEGYVTTAQQVAITLQEDGAIEQSVLNFLERFISTRSFGIPGNLTDPNNDNHIKLKRAAKAAIRAGKKLLIDGKILVKDTVDWDTTTTFYDNLDPTINNGIGKYLPIIGNYNGDGIYGLYSSFAGTSKEIVKYRGQGEAIFTGVTLRFYNSGAFSATAYQNLHNTKLLRVMNSDRLPILYNQVGGILESTGGVSIGGGTAIWLDDCMSPYLEGNFIVYYTMYGVCRDAGTPHQPLIGLTPRISTSGFFAKNYFGGGRPDATSRNQCCSINVGYGDTYTQNVFENNSRGRAVYINIDNCKFENNWHEGTYDTVLIAGGFGSQFMGSLSIQFGPTNYVLEGLESYSIAGALALGTPNSVSLTRLNILDCGFYFPRTRLSGNALIQGNAVITGSLQSAYFSVKESNADITMIVGDTNGVVFNDETIMHCHNPVGGNTRLRMSSGGTASSSSNYLVDLVSNPSNGSVGLRVDVNSNKRIDIAFQGTDGFYLANSAAGRYLLPASDNNVKLGDPSGYRFSQLAAGTSTIATSDARLKTGFVYSDSPEFNNILDAWELVNYVIYQFKDSVETKGDSARKHVGLIAQEVKEAFEAKGIDPFSIGILCYDSWEASYVEEEVEEEYTHYEDMEIPKILCDEAGNPVDLKGNLLDKTKPKLFVKTISIESAPVTKTRLVKTGKMVKVKDAGDIYGIRYEEALALECALIRRKLKKLGV